MEAGKFNMLIEKKATFRQDFTIFNTYDEKTNTGTVMDLTGVTVSAKIKLKIADSSPVLTFTTSLVTDGSDGVIRLELSAAQTSSIAWAQAVYDVLLTFPSGDVWKYIEGTINVSKTAS